MKIKVFGTNTYIRIGTTKVVTVPDDSRKDEPKPNYWNMLRVRLENADGEAMPDTEFGVGIAVPCGDPYKDPQTEKQPAETTEDKKEEDTPESKPQEEVPSSKEETEKPSEATATSDADEKNSQ